MTKGRHALPIGAFFAASLLLLASFAAATTVTVNGRQLLVNGATFTIRGVDYSPTSVGSRPIVAGGTYAFWTDASQPYLTDFPLIKAMGANVIRTYDATQATKAALDAAAANGLYVIMGFPVHPTDIGNVSQMSIDVSSFTTMVAAWASHPAVLMWEFGSEVSTTTSTTPFAPSVWYTLLNTAAGAAKAVDASHPVSTSNFDTVNIGLSASGADDTNGVPNLDVWGLTVYRGPTLNCNGNVFAQYSALSKKPMYISEFGQGAFNSTTDKEDQFQQSTVINSLWSTIDSNLSVNSSNNVAIGGSVFEWTDEWWKSNFNTSDSVQDAPLNSLPGGLPGDYTNACYVNQPAQFEEWWGITSIQPASAGNPNARGLREAYYTLQSQWAPGNSATNQNLPLIAWIKNFPNPFVAGTQMTLQIQLNQPATLGVQIFDMSGHKVNELAGPPQDVGNNLMQFQWSGNTGGGSQAACGLYIARIEASAGTQDVVQYQRIVIVK